MTDDYKIFRKGGTDTDSIFSKQLEMIVVLNDTEEGKLARKRFVHDAQNAINRLKRVEYLLDEDSGIEKEIKEDIVIGLRDSSAELLKLHAIISKVLDSN